MMADMSLCKITKFYRLIFYENQSYIWIVKLFSRASNKRNLLYFEWSHKILHFQIKTFTSRSIVWDGLFQALRLKWILFELGNLISNSHRNKSICCSTQSKKKTNRLNCAYQDGHTHNTLKHNLPVRKKKWMLFLNNLLSFIEVKVIAIDFEKFNSCQLLQRLFNKSQGDNNFLRFFS